MGWPMPDAGANDPARGRLLARRSVTARRSFFSWSQTVAEPGHERARLAADLYAPASAAATSGEHADRDDLRVVASLLGAGLESSELPRGRTPPWALAGTGRADHYSGLFKVWRLDLVGAVWPYLVGWSRWVSAVWRRPAPGVRTAWARARRDPARTMSLRARVTPV